MSLYRFGICFFLCLMGIVQAQRAADTLQWVSQYDHARSLMPTDPDSSLILAQQARQTARQVQFSRGEALSLQLFANVYAYILRKPALALAYLDSAEAVAPRPFPRKFASASLQVRAQVHSDLGRYANAANELLQAVALLEQPPVDSNALPGVYNNLGNLIMKQLDHEKALEYFKKGLSLAIKINNKKEETNILGNMATVYLNTMKLDSALFILDKATAISRKYNFISALISQELNIAIVLFEKKENKEARKHLLYILPYIEKTKNYYRLINCLSNIAHSYRQENPQQGLVYARRAEALLDSIPRESWEWKRNLYKVTAELYANARQYERAYHYANIAEDAADSLFNTEQRDKIALERENYEVNKRDAQIAALASQQILATNQRNWGLAVAALVFIFAIFATINARRRRRLNHQLATANADLQTVNATKDRIMSILSHDLRSPLNTLNSFLQLLRERDMPAPQRERAERQISTQLQATVAMLDNLLHWSLTQVKGRAIQAEPLILKEIADHAAEPLSGLADLKSLRLEMEIPGDLAVVADREMAVFIIRNLLTNAIKFSPVGASIRLSATQAGAQIQLAVSDSGPGMDAAKISTLFSMRENTSTTGTAKEKGTGIGLPIAAEMAAKNNGSLHASSQLGHGSTFTLCLPAVLERF